MTRPFTGMALRLLFMLLAFVLAIGLFTVAKNAGWLTIIGIDSESQDTQVIQAVERTQEVALVSLGIEGLKEEKRNSKVLGTGVPGTGEVVFLQYKFRAKLGIDGAKVDITKTGEAAYRISVPDFIFIGYAKPTFKVATEDGGVLSGITPDIDKVEMVNDILNGEARQKYVEDYDKLLRDQTEAFYHRLITSIDPAAKTTFEFGP